MRGEVRIEKVGNRIHASIPYAGGQGPIFAKRVPGASWSKSTKTWTYPLEWNVCLRMREVFGQSLKIGLDLAAWATTEKQRVAALTSLVKQDTAELTLLPQLAPRLAAAMATRTYQQVGAAFAVSAIQTLIADQPRLGKTLVALAAIVERGVYGRHLIFCPSTAIEVAWVPEIARWLGEDFATAVAVVGDRQERQFKLDEVALYSGDRMHTFVICNIEMAQIRMEKDPITKRPTGNRLPAEWPALFRTSWSSLVVDESHLALVGQNNDKTMTATRFGLMQLSKGNMDALKLALSGTPMRGRPHQIWGTLNWLRPNVYTSYWRWVETYFDVSDNGYGKVIGEMLPNVEAAYDRELSTIMIRRTTAEVRSEIPARDYGGTLLEPANPASPKGVWLDMEPAQARAYDKMIAEGLVDGQLTVNGILAEFTRAKQLANQTLKVTRGMAQPALPSNKFNWVLQFLAERGIAKTSEAWGDGKVVIGSQFTETLEIFSAELTRLGIDNVLLSGKVPQGRRPAMVERFKSADGPRVFLIQTKTGGVAITLDVADEIVIVDRTFIPDDQEQLEYRIDNAGGEIRPKMVWYLNSLGTVDEGIARLNTSRDRDVKWLLDGRRGVAAVMAVLRGEEVAA